MKFSHIVLLGILAAGLSSCSTFVVEGRYSYDSAIDHSALKSFALLPVDDSTFSTPESTARFRIAMVRALSAKGFIENPGNPDFLVRAAPVETYREMYALSGDIVIPTAMLHVSFVRPSDGKRVYEASAYAYYEPSWSQEDKNSIVDDAVEVIVAEFPPRK